MSNRVNRIRAIKQQSRKDTAVMLKPLEEISQNSSEEALHLYSFTELEMPDFIQFDSYFTMDTEISEADLKEQVVELQHRFAKEHSSSFFDQSRDQLIGVIANKFMLGGVVANWDHAGGNVDTIHNVRQKDEDGNLLYASKPFKEKYENRQVYNKDISDAYHKDQDYIRINKKYSEQKDNGELVDAYSGENISRNDKYDLDHTISAKEIHDDAGRILAGVDGRDLANTESNLNPTNPSINRSKKQKTADDFIKKLEETNEARIAKIEELKQKDSLTDKERKKLNKLERLNEVQQDELKRLDKQARKEYEATLRKEYYLSKEFLGNVGKTSVKEGAKMGLQQVIGLFVTETISAVFDEIRDAIKSGIKKGKSFWEDLKIRLERIIKRIASKWKEALTQGFDGMVSGIFSNLVTVLINTVITTAKNIVRLIREGFFAIIKAVKLLINPPEGMTKAQAFHEAGKIIITALAVSVGILMEESIDKLPPMKAIRSVPVIGELLYSTMFGLFTALITSFGLWGWDKLDYFGVKEAAQHEFVMNALKEDRNKTMQQHQAWLDTVKENDPKRYLFLLNELEVLGV